MSGKAIRETVGFLAVVGSMVFVGVEIQQNTAATRSATQQAIYDAGRQGSYALMANLPLLEVLLAIENDPSQLETFSGTIEGRLLRAFWNARFNEMENSYFHFREGTLDPEPWSGWEGYITEVVGDPTFPYHWDMLQARYGDEFRAMIDGVFVDL